MPRHVTLPDQTREWRSDEAGFILSEMAKWGKVVKEAGIKAE